MANRIHRTPADVPSYMLYGEPFGHLFPDVLHCEAIGERSGPHDWTIRPHRHLGLHQFLLLRAGGVGVSGDGGRHDLAAPAAMMNAPGAVHGFRFEPGSEGVCVTVPSAVLARSLGGNAVLLDRVSRSLYLSGRAVAEGFEEVSAAFAGLARDYASPAEGRAEALLCRLGLVALWFARASCRRDGEPAGDGRPRDGTVGRFVALVEDTYRGGLPLDHYARRLGVSAQHLTRLCRRHLGVSALRVVHDRRLLEARRRLSYTPDPIAVIAADLGFADPSYFTRAFARQAGCTPSDFRRALGRAS